MQLTQPEAALRCMSTWMHQSTLDSLNSQYFQAIVSEYYYIAFSNLSVVDQWVNNVFWYEGGSEPPNPPGYVRHCCDYSWCSRIMTAAL